MDSFSPFQRKRAEQADALLNNIRIASPCPANWDSMVGDDRVRHCAECDLNVYNFSVMTKLEVLELLKQRNGQRLCARFYHRADGTLLTRDCPWSLRAMARKVSRRAAAILSLVLSTGVAFAKNKPKEKASCECQTIQQKESGVNVTVMDQQGAVIQNAEIILERKSLHEIIKGQSDATGEWSQTKLPAGRYSMTIKSNSFRTLKSTLDIREGALVTLKLKLLAGEVNGGVVVVEAAAGAIGEVGGTISYTES